MKGHHKLGIYEKSYESALMMYEMTKGFPKEERFAMADQVRRAATSVPLNIAEGYAKRESQAEFKRFLMMAIGSNTEISVLLDFARNLGYISEAEYEKANAANEETGRMLSSFIKTVSDKI